MSLATAPSLETGTWVCSAPVDTFTLGAETGKKLAGGEILLLHGKLGAGKTLFVKGIAQALGIDPEEVTSPSFTLVDVHRGRLPFFHIDLYRLEDSASAAHAVDLDEIISDERAVLAIEWAERMGHYPLPNSFWHVTIEGDGADPRRITISR